MEIIKVFSASGDIALERDLAGIDKPLMIIAGEKPQLVEVVPPGAEVLGALLRDEDGWTLASAKADTPVVSGPKSGSDFHLAAGVPCAIGPWIFRIEREGALAGTVLLWRVGSSAVAADPLLPGRNIVSSVGDGSYAVNPAVGGVELCSIFPTADGADVSAGGEASERLAVPFATLFGVGRFQGMVMSAEDAAKAVKSGSPLSWPSRATRSGLMAMLLLIGLISLAALSIVKKTSALEDLLARKTGPELVERKLAGDAALSSDEDALVFESTFFKTIPLLTTSERSPLTHNLIRRARQILDHLQGPAIENNRRMLEEKLSLLQAIDDIQASAHKGDWNALRQTLAAIDRSKFINCDADAFYDDAVEVADFVTDVLPKFFIAVANDDADAAKGEGARLNEYFDALKDNIFMSGEIVRRERDIAQIRWDALSAYIKARNAFLASPAASSADLRDAWADLADAFDLDDDDNTFAPMLEHERAELAKAILKRGSENAEPVELVNLCSLGETIGINDAKLADWRKRVDDVRRDLYARYRKMYSDYRMLCAVSPESPDAVKILDSMIALGLEDNQFHKWALREKERVSAKSSNEIPEEAK